MIVDRRESNARFFIRSKLNVLNSFPRFWIENWWRWRGWETLNLESRIVCDIIWIATLFFKKKKIKSRSVIQFITHPSTFSNSWSVFVCLWWWAKLWRRPTHYQSPNPNNLKSRVQRWWMDWGAQIWWSKRLSKSINIPNWSRVRLWASWGFGWWYRRPMRSTEKEKDQPSWDQTGFNDWTSMIRLDDLLDRLRWA